MHRLILIGMSILSFPAVGCLPPTPCEIVPGATECEASPAATTPCASPPCDSAEETPTEPWVHPSDTPIPTPTGTPWPEVGHLSGIKFVGESTNDRAGECIGGAGDVDGDGHDDILIGAAAYDDTGSGDDQGAAYLYYGPITEGIYPLGDADVRFVGEKAGDRMGTFVGGGGDLNGDGNADVIITADNYVEDGSELAEAGRVYIFFGPFSREESLTSPSMAITATETQEFFGYEAAVLRSADGLGDHNGAPDLLIGAPKAPGETGDGYGGRAYLFYNPTLAPNESLTSSAADVIFQQPTDGNALGSAVQSAGDVDNDGYSDFLIGDSLFDGDVDGDTGACTYAVSPSVNANCGGVFIVYGNLSYTGGDNSLIEPSEIVDVDNHVGALFLGERGDSNLGANLSIKSMDLDGDAYGDFAVGAAYGGMATRAGAIYVFRGKKDRFSGANSVTSADYIIRGVEDLQEFGRTFDFGDFDGDNCLDLVAGAPCINTVCPTSSNSGAVYVVFNIWSKLSSLGINDVTIDTISDFIVTGERSGDSLGWVTNAGDLDNNSKDEILMAAPRQDYSDFGQSESLGNRGAIYLKYGRPPPQ